MESIFSKTLSQLEEEMLALNQKKFRATQIYTWIYQKKVLDFNLMSDISLNNLNYSYFFHFLSFLIISYF